MKIIKAFLITLILLFSFTGISQRITGFVLDEQNNPIPFAKVFVKNYTNTGAITNLEGKYTFNVAEGNFEVMYSSMGFETQTLNVTVKGVNDTKQDVYLMKIHI